MPLCLYFYANKCSKEDCPFLHVKLGIDVPVCEKFTAVSSSEPFKVDLSIVLFNIGIPFIYFSPVYQLVRTSILLYYIKRDDIYICISVAILLTPRHQP